MGRLTERFIAASLVYFVLGMVLGIFLIFLPEWPGVYRTLHVHINLLGWLLMVVYAGGYYVIPRFAGARLYSQKLAEFQFWLANGALVAMCVFWVFVAYQEPNTLAHVFFYSLLAISSVVVVISALLFVYNLVMTMKPR